MIRLPPARANPPMAATHRIAALAVLLPLAGCGAQAVPARSTAPAAAAAPASHAAGSATAAKAKTTKVQIKDFEFKPGKVTIATGGRITWTNKDAANHTVTFKTGPKDLGNLNHGKSRSATFAKAGTYKYVCQYHPNMHGTVIVKAARLRFARPG
jgi:plastocyanin